jgi:hypothetical protein
VCRAASLAGMEIRIGVVHTPKEIALDVDASVDEVKERVQKALADDDGVLWLTDTHGRSVGIPSERVAYVEIETDSSAKRVGFGRG